MTSVGIKVGGAWAVLDQQQEQHKAVITELCHQLTCLQTSHEQLFQNYDQLQLQHKKLVDDNARTVDKLKHNQDLLSGATNQSETSKFLFQELEVVKQDEISQLRQIIRDHQDTAVGNKAACKAQLQALETQVAELRQIIDSSMHTKRASTLKLETAMNALNLSKGDARRFIEELQAVKGKVEELTAERDKAMSEHVIVRQQRDCHADHAQLLVKEIKRLQSQLQALQLQQSQAAAALQSSMEKQPCRKQQGGRKPAGGAVEMKTSEGTVPKEDDGDSQTSVKSFDGRDVKNALHKKPFDLSKGSRHKQDVSSNAILKQAQQLRAASRTN
ncbi:TPA: hypothetical protein ACH3X2_011007 [Trebouxia sp. C0005]